MQDYTRSITLLLSGETNDLLNDLATHFNGNKSEVIKKSVALLELALKTQQEGGRVEFINDAKKTRKALSDLSELN